MILTVDIGNTFTHAGVFDTSKPVEKVIFPTKSVADSHTLPKEIIKLSKYKITRAGISSVVPTVDIYWKYMVEKNFGIKPIFISTKLKLPVKIKVESPAKLGADRICIASAGFKYYKNNVIIIGFGTATTYDIVLKSGEYIGGMIAPGIKTSAESLSTNTAKLPLLDEEKLVFPKDPVGKNTTGALQSGIMYSALDAMEGMVKRIEKKYKRKFRIILTGGFARIINSKTSLRTVVKENLVMEGINFILKHNYAE